MSLSFIQNCLALFHGTGENVYNLTRLNTEQDIVHKMDFTYIVDFIQEKTGLRPKKNRFWSWSCTRNWRWL